MDALSKKLQNLGVHDIRNAGRFVQNMVVQYEPYQVDIRRATNTDAWGPTTKYLQKVIRNKYQVPLLLMTEYILKRIVDHVARRPKNLYEKARKEYVNYGAEWRVVLKCLVVIEFLMLNVDENEELSQIKNCLETHRQILSNSVMNFKVEFSNDGKMEVHERGIQKQCQEVIRLIDDPGFLKSERDRTRKNALKIQMSGSTSSSDTATNGIMPDYNANAIDSVNFNLEEHTATYNNNENQRTRRLSNIEEQRKQRREILREKIKQSEWQRKQSAGSAPADFEDQQARMNEQVPDLLDMDFDTPPATTATTSTTSDDEFDDFQSSLGPSKPLTVAPAAANAFAPATTHDAFADLFNKSKSLI